MLPNTAQLRSLPGNNVISPSHRHVILAAPLPSVQSLSAKTRHHQLCKATSGNPPLTDDGFVDAGPRDAQPDYTAIDAQPLNRLIYSLFRNKMVQALGGKDSPMQGYPAIIDLTRRLNALGSPQDTQTATRKILNSLFPSWLPPAFKVMFSKPFPEFSCRLNALATWATCQWLMGECQVNDVELDDGTIGTGHGVLVTRCRYLEDAGCASVCINSCKVPTQTFFLKDMGLPLTMTPNYETYECQFSFGKTPLNENDDEAFKTPCFVGCPSKKKQNNLSVVEAAAGSDQEMEEMVHLASEKP